MKKGAKILFAAQDPGGFNSLVSVIKSLKKRKIEVKVFLANESRVIAKKNKINFVDGSSLTGKKLEQAFDEFSPSLVVTATSDGLSLDKRILQLAKRKKIHVISVVDFWSNYKTRFSNPKTGDMAFLPDQICIIDEHMKSGMVREGFDNKSLRITGNPFFDGFNKSKDREEYILFVSQPFSELGDTAFDEVNIFEDYVKSLDIIKERNLVIISFHPREKNKQKFNSIISNSSIKIKTSKKSGDELADNAKLVLGINTMALFRAALKGKKAISYQPGVKKKDDVLLSNHLGLSAAVYDSRFLGDTIKRMLKNKDDQGKLKKMRKKYVENNSTQKVIKEIEKMI